MIRVAIVQTELLHYRVPFFEALSRANPDWQVEILHSGRKISGQGAGAGVRFTETAIARRHIRFLGFNLSLQTGALRRLCSSAVDVVILEGSFGICSNMLILLVRSFSGRKVLYWITGWDRPNVQGWRKGLRRDIISWLAKRADGLIVYGSAARKYMLDHDVRPERITVAQNTVDVESMAAGDAAWRQRGRKLRAELGIKGDCVLYVGRVLPMKRLEDLILAMRGVNELLPDAELVVVGTGPDLGRVRALAGKGTHFAGEVVDGVEAYFAAADIFVMPGTGGLAINQAMAFGLPVVATESDGTHEDLVLAGDNGLIAPVGNPASLAECIVHILEDPHRRARMGERSRQIVLGRASLENMVHKFSWAVRRIVAPATSEASLPRAEGFDV